jgi:hypothetical protein
MISVSVSVTVTVSGRGVTVTVTGVPGRIMISLPVGFGGSQPAALADVELVEAVSWPNCVPRVYQGQVVNCSQDFSSNELRDLRC